MSKNEINLMPWRITQHQQKFKIFLWQLLGFISSVIAVWVICFYMTQQLKQQITLQQQQIEQGKSRLNQVTKNIEQQRQLHIETESAYPIVWQKTQQLFTLLSQLPFVEGELQQLIWQAKTERISSLSLQGYTLNQKELEQIQQFLQQQDFSQAIQLKELLPEENHLHFQFELQAK